MPNSDEIARLTESSLERSFELLYRSEHLGVAIATEDRVVDANGAFLQLIGYSREEMLAGVIDWRAMTPPEHLPLDIVGLQQVAELGACAPYEKSYILRDGSRVNFAIGAVRLRQDPLTWAAYTVDLSATERLRRGERELNARRAALNRLAHELNNPLAALTLLLHVACGYPDTPPNLSNTLGEACFQLQRVTDLVKQVLTDTGLQPSIAD